MALLPYVDFSACSVDVRDALAGMPRKLNLFRMWAHAKTSFVPALRLGGAIMSRQKLKPYYRELVVLLTAKLEGGAYEWSHHTPIAENVGCTRAQIAALDALRIEDDCFDQREKLLLRFVQEVVEEVRAREETVMSMAQLFSPQEVVEVIVTCGYYMMLARITETTRTEIDPPVGASVLEELARLR